MIIVALALPYARPLVCDVVEHEAPRGERAMAEHASMQTQPAGCGSCDTSMHCCVVPVGPTADREADMTLLDHPAPEPAVPSLAPVSNTSAPLTPPPKA